MKFYTYLLVGALIFTASCAGTNKSLRNSRKQDKENAVQGTSIKRTLMPATPIKEVEEKLVSNDEKDPSPQKYFVIIGSFKDPANAKDHQAVVRKAGFASEILKNDAGLYRVSVLATDDITDARTEVRRIWAKFPQYSDTWMLIRKD